MAYCTLLFDLDGTLADSDGLHLHAFQDLLASGDIHPGISNLGGDGSALPARIDQAFFKANCAGRTSKMILEGAFGVTDPELVAALAAKKEARFLELVSTDLIPVVGLLPLLRHATTAGWGMALVTNAPRPTTELMIAALGLEEWLPKSVWVLGVECANPKPHPDPYLTALANLGATAETALVFEDSPNGVRAGVAAEIRTVGVLTSQAEQTLLDVGASFGVPDFASPRLWEVLGSAVPLSPAAALVDCAKQRVAGWMPFPAFIGRYGGGAGLKHRDPVLSVIAAGGSGDLTDLRRRVMAGVRAALLEHHANPMVAGCELPQYPEGEGEGVSWSWASALVVQPRLSPEVGADEGVHNLFCQPWLFDDFIASSAGVANEEGRSAWPLIGVFDAGGHDDDDASGVAAPPARDAPDGAGIGWAGYSSGPVRSSSSEAEADDAAVAVELRPADQHCHLVGEIHDFMV